MKTLQIMPQIPPRHFHPLQGERAGVRASNQNREAALSAPDLDSALCREIHRLTGINPCPGCGG
jgi:hypothetical protein